MPSCRLTAEARSDAPPATVFRLLADIGGWSSWGAWTHTSLEAEAPGGGGGVGAIRRLESRAWGRTILSRERVVALAPDAHLAYALVSGLPLVNYRGEVTLAPDGGGTRITWSSQFDPEVWGTGWFWRAVLGRFLADAAARLARAAEGAGPGSPGRPPLAPPGGEGAGG